MGAIAFALEILTQVPALIAAGVQVKGLIDSGTASLQAMQNEKRDPTPAEWSALNAQIAALQKELHG